LVDFELIE